MKRRMTQHVTLVASTTLLTMLFCAPLFASTPDLEQDRDSAPDTQNEEVASPSGPTVSTWGAWKLRADEISADRANGNVTATHANWIVRATSARIRSDGSGKVIDFQGKVRLARNDQTTPIVIGATQASADSMAGSVRFGSSASQPLAFLARASDDWIMHAETIVVRLEDGQVSLQRIRKTTPKTISPRAALVR